MAFLRAYGTGPRPLLALHCALAHGGTWRALARELRGATTYAPDLPAHGRSPSWTPPHSQHDTATRWAMELAEHLGQGAPIDILGHSFGGTVAIRLAQLRPDLVRSLTLFEPVLFSLAIQAQGEGARQWLVHNATFEQLFTQGRTAEAAATFHSLWGTGPALSDLPATARNAIINSIHLIPDAGETLVQDRPRLIAPGRIEAMQMPVLLIEGDRSPPVAGEILDQLAQRLPRATRHKVAGAAHMLPLTHARDVGGRVRSHLGL